MAKDFLLWQRFFLLTDRQAVPIRPQSNIHPSSRLHPETEMVQESRDGARWYARDSAVFEDRFHPVVVGANADLHSRLGPHLTNIIAKRSLLVTSLACCLMPMPFRDLSWWLGRIRGWLVTSFVRVLIPASSRGR